MKRGLFIVSLSSILLSSCALQIGEGKLIESNSQESSYSDDSSQTTETEFISFGVYPMSVVSADDICKALDEKTRDSLGLYWYQGEHYAKLTAAPYSDGLVFSNGNPVIKGNSYYFLCETINWMVIRTQKNIFAQEKLIAKYAISEMVLDVEPFDDDSNNYANSSIRNWLNNDFFQKAFFESDKSSITITEVDNSAATTPYAVNENACEDTSDYVCLPSFKEIDNLGNQRSPYTDYALAKGVLPFDYYSDGDASRACEYWTRSPEASYPSSVVTALPDGKVRDSGVDSTVVGVRPCVSII